MKPYLRPIQFLVLAACSAAAIVVGIICLPHDNYIRFQQLASESVHYLRVKWIYERIHFDATPIEIAFIGTSHTQSGIDSNKTEETLRASGDTSHVVNFAVPHLGRDLQFLLARELLEHRKIKTLVIELQQIEARAPHPGFQRLASIPDLLHAPLIVNTGLVENFVRLPLRQLALFDRTMRPAHFGFSEHFQPEKYEGQHFNDTYYLHGIDTPRTMVNERSYFKKELDNIRIDFEQKQKLAKKFDIGFLGENILYRYNNTYLRKIIELAQSHSVNLIFLYLPYLDAPVMPAEYNRLRTFGTVIAFDDVLNNPKLWQNADHLNYYGAQALSTVIAPKIIPAKR